MSKTKCRLFKGKSLSYYNGVSGLCKEVYGEWTNSSKIGERDHLTFLRRPAGICRVNYVDFACNGRYLACIEVKCITEEQNSLAWNNLLPISQLLLLQPTPQQPDNSNVNNCRAYYTEEINDFEIAASIELDFIDIYCVTLSSDTNAIAVYGFSYKEIPRKPTISVYEFVSSHTSICIELKSKLTFTSCEILSAKVTTTNFLPTNDHILVTSICTDYHSVRKTNFLDFWNIQSNLHFASLSLVKECPKLKGYISSNSFSSDGKILALLSSTKDWQLVLFSVAANKFGKLFSLKQQDFGDPIDHFNAFCEFGINFRPYDLLVLSEGGKLSRMTIDPEKLTVKEVTISIAIFADNLSKIVAMKYCPASSRCYIRTENNISFVDTDNGATTIEYELSADDRTSKGSSGMTVSKTGRQLAIIVDSHTVKVVQSRFMDNSLKNLCRCSIIKFIPENKIPQLDLPKCLISYLLYGKL